MSLIESVGTTSWKWISLHRHWCNACFSKCRTFPNFSFTKSHTTSWKNNRFDFFQPTNFSVMVRWLCACSWEWPRHVHASWWWFVVMFVCGMFMRKGVQRVCSSWRMWMSMCMFVLMVMFMVVVVDGDDQSRQRCHGLFHRVPYAHRSPIPKYYFRDTIYMKMTVERNRLKGFSRCRVSAPKRSRRAFSISSPAQKMVLNIQLMRVLLECC